MKRIAIFHTHGGLGDLLLSYPVIQAFSDAYPDAEIFYVTPPNLEDAIRAHPRVKEVFSLSSGLKPAWELAERLREKKVGLACALWSTNRIGLLLRFLQIPIRIGQGGRWLSPFFFTHRVAVRSASGDLKSHWVECLLDYPRAAGIFPKTTEIRVTLNQEAREKALRILQEAGISPEEPFMVLHPGKGEDVLKRNWPVALFSRVGDDLVKEGFRVILTGKKNEIPLVTKILEGMKLKAQSAAGRTDFFSLAALLEKAKCVICPDSGPMHLAGAVLTPVAALFAMKADVPERWRPWGAPYRIVRPSFFPCRSWCSKETCPDFQCYHALSPEEIVKAALALASEKVRS